MSRAGETGLDDRPRSLLVRISYLGRKLLWRSCQASVVELPDLLRGPLPICQPSPCSFRAS